jgi:hypothetical protein
MNLVLLHLVKCQVSCDLTMKTEAYSLGYCSEILT